MCQQALLWNTAVESFVIGSRKIDWTQKMLKISGQVVKEQDTL